MGWHVRQIRQCWCGSQTVGSAPDEDRLNNVGAGRDGVQCSPFRSQKGNFGLNVFPTQPGTKGAMNSKRVFLAVLALAISFSTTKVAAQSLTTGSISGAVTDPSNALIPKAQVTLKDNSKGTTQETKTNASGLYEFALLACSQQLHRDGICCWIPGGEPHGERGSRSSYNVEHSNDSRRGGYDDHRDRSSSADPDRQREFGIHNQ
jgi:hypothetical protein